LYNHAVWYIAALYIFLTYINKLPRMLFSKIEQMKVTMAVLHLSQIT